MKEIRLRPGAVADLREIRRYTLRTWGASQARAYLEELGCGIQAIATGDAFTTQVRAGSGVFRRCRCREHYIFFRETADVLDVIRIFHAKMDVVRRLVDE